MLTVGESFEDRRLLPRPLALQVVAGSLRDLLVVFDTFSAAPGGWEFTLRVMSPARGGSSAEELAGAMWDSAMRPGRDGVVDVRAEVLERGGQAVQLEVTLRDARSSDGSLDARLRVPLLPPADSTVRLTLRWDVDEVAADVSGGDLVAAAADAVRLWD